MEIRCRNVNEAVSEALWKLKVMGVEESSRNGAVMVFPEPVMTTYLRPQERVLFWPERDCNPWFHMLEALWMLAGRCDVEFVQQFNSKIVEYSDNGFNFNAAYGFRWREEFGLDQLTFIIKELKRDPSSRRAVLQMWNPWDLLKDTKDKACNTQAYFDCRGGKLNMTVTNRSNDLIWGCYGANAVHFSMLQEFLAIAVGLPLGVYRQFSNNLHLYTDKHQHWLNCPPSHRDYDPYPSGVLSHPLYKRLSWQQFLQEVEDFCEEPERGASSRSKLIRSVAHPMYASWQERKAGGVGLDPLRKCAAEDWQLACRQWIERRQHA